MKVETSGVINISEAGTTFSGKKTDKGLKPILDRGFAWNQEASVSITDGISVSLGIASGKISFDHQADYALITGITNYIKACEPMKTIQS